MSTKKRIVRGFKFLNPNGCTSYEGKEYPYILPEPGKKWGKWFRHPDPCKPDGLACGSGGWHISKRLNDEWGKGRYPWFAEGRIILGEDSNKVRVVEIRLRRVSRKAFEKLLRIGWGKESTLWNADLSNADLSDADLSNADLSDADLSDADLSDADLSNANLWNADLSDADLSNADLSNANLWNANLWNADLSNANLSPVYNLIEAVLKNARYNLRTQWPKGFNPKLKKHGLIEED